MSFCLRSQLRVALTLWASNRDEERLAVLAKEGGVAAEEAGFFLVRPPEFDLPPPQPEYDAENERGVRVTMRRDY